MIKRSAGILDEYEKEISNFNSFQKEYIHDYSHVGCGMYIFAHCRIKLI